MENYASLLNNLLLSYHSDSPSYKFTYVFYNIVNTPVSKPDYLTDEQWRNLYRGEYLLPVVLNRDGVLKRKQMQNELILKLNASKYSLLKRIDGLKLLKEKIRSRFQQIRVLYRKVVRMYVDTSATMNITLNMANIVLRDPFVVSTECIPYLISQKRTLKDLEVEVAEELRKVESKARNDLLNM